MGIAADLIGRSNRLGADSRTTNYAGGNTSASGEFTDPVTGRPAEVLWVKGSGGDLGTLTESGLATLRPGYQLGLDIRAVQHDNPKAIGCILGGHGITAWGATSEECESNSLDIIRTAEAHIVEHGSAEPFGAVVPGHEPLPEAEHRARAATLAPLAALGTSCPDHFLRTKVSPMVLNLPAAAPVEDVVDGLRALHADYRRDYAAYNERNATADSPAIRGADPAIVLVPGVGMFSFGKDKQTARVAGEFYVNAINVMLGAKALSTYAPIAESEKFRNEYWRLEEAKLAPMPMPKPKPLAGRTALVTGAGSGIGKADQSHQVRLLAAEPGPHGIRVNGVNPDGVVRGSGLFAGGWGADRAKVYSVLEEDLGIFYAQRTLLKREVLPDQVANAVFALAAGELSHITGLHVPVAAGVAAAFLR